MNASGRHLSCGHSESRSPDRPRFLLLQVAGPSAGRTGCPRGRHHGKCGFCGSFERTTVQSQQRHLQFYCRFGYRRVWASLPWKALRHTDDAFATLCFCLQTSEPVPMLNNKPRIISALQFMLLFKSSRIFLYLYKRFGIMTLRRLKLTPENKGTCNTLISLSWNSFHQ